MLTITESLPEVVEPGDFLLELGPQLIPMLEFEGVGVDVLETGSADLSGGCLLQPTADCHLAGNLVILDGCQLLEKLSVNWVIWESSLNCFELQATTSPDPSVALRYRSNDSRKLGARHSFGINQVMVLIPELRVQQCQNHL